jgi:hypothetical protein
MKTTGFQYSPLIIGWKGSVYKLKYNPLKYSLSFSFRWEKKRPLNN